MMIVTGTVNWVRGLSRSVKVAGGVGAIAGAIYSVSQAAPVIEPYWYAHRGYVRYYDDAHVTEIIKRLNHVQLVQNKERRQLLIDEAAKRDIELQGETAKQAPQYRALVQDRVDRIKEELKTLEEQDNSLFKEQKAISGGH